jgi:RimJ/RimL family protein N-acetyltransferase
MSGTDTMSLHLAAITRANCLTAKEWRNGFRQALRTPMLLTDEMQNTFFDKVATDRHCEDRYWEIRQDASFVGLGGLSDIEWENRLAEISLFISPDVHGRGYGTESVHLLCEEGFDRMNLRTILGEAFLCNPNWHFWEKLTTSFGGYNTILPNRKFWDGKYWGSYYFSWDRDCKWR